MDNPRTFSVDAAIKALVNMRSMLIARMRAPHCSPMMYNECRSHVLQIDQQLRDQKAQVTVEGIPYRTWTRAERRRHDRADKRTFTDRVVQRAGNVVKIK